MKTFAVLLPMLGLAMIGHAGQTNQTDFKHTGPAPQPTAPQEESLMTMPRTNALQRLARPEVTYGGVVPELRKKKMQFFKPPPPPGRDFQNISVNPVTGRAEGIILFSINF